MPLYLVVYAAYYVLPTRQGLQTVTQVWSPGLSIEEEVEEGEGEEEGEKEEHCVIILAITV